MQERKKVMAEQVLDLVRRRFIHGSSVALEPVACELVEAGVLLARIELERVRRAPGATADEGRDLVASIRGADVVPAFALGAKGTGHDGSAFRKKTEAPRAAGPLHDRGVSPPASRAAREG
jgi:hypothetical protein